jgi:hypothetical protein
MARGNRQDVAGDRRLSRKKLGNPEQLRRSERSSFKKKNQGVSFAAD